MARNQGSSTTWPKSYPSTWSCHLCVLNNISSVGGIFWRIDIWRDPSSHPCRLIPKRGLSHAHFIFFCIPSAKLLNLKHNMPIFCCEFSPSSYAWTMKSARNDFQSRIWIALHTLNFICKLHTEVVLLIMEVMQHCVHIEHQEQPPLKASEKLLGDFMACMDLNPFPTPSHRLSGHFTHLKHQIFLQVRLQRKRLCER